MVVECVSKVQLTDFAAGLGEGVWQINFKCNHDSSPSLHLPPLKCPLLLSLDFPLCWYPWISQAKLPEISVSPLCSYCLFISEFHLVLYFFTFVPL